MKLRPVLLVLLLLSGFYYVTTHVQTSGALSQWVHHAVAPIAAETDAATGSMLGPLQLTTASAGAGVRHGGAAEYCGL